MAYKMTAQGLQWVADAPAPKLDEYVPPPPEKSAKLNAETVGQKVQQAAAKPAPALVATPSTPIRPAAPAPAPVNVRQPTVAAAAPAPPMPQFSAPQVQVQAPPPPPPVGAPTLQTNSTADPNSKQFLSQLQVRTQQQQAGENAPVTASADRAIDLARRDIGDAAAAGKKRKQEELLSRGLSSKAGAGAGQVRAIDEAARTRGARASSDIALGRERDQDQLNLARTGQTNALYGQLGSASQVPFSQQLQGNQQALETWKANEAAQIGRANLAQNAATTNAQLQSSQQAQQQAMWMSLMGMR